MKSVTWVPKITKSTFAERKWNPERLPQPSRKLIFFLPKRSRYSLFYEFPRNTMWLHMFGKMVANVYIWAAIFRKIWGRIEFLRIYEKRNEEK